MAITTIHPITATIGASISYITAVHKTEELLYVDSFGCGIETAAFDFECTLKMTTRADSDKGHPAYHLIQSFAPGEVTPELAHRIGKELADKLLDGKYIQFKPPGKERFVRGYEKSLETEYTRERIKERIEETVEHRRERFKFLVKPKMIDTSQQRFQESPGLKHWANKQNLKTAAKIMSDFGDQAQMAEKISELEQTIKTNYKAQVKAEHRRRDRKDVIGDAIADSFMRMEESKEISA